MSKEPKLIIDVAYNAGEDRLRMSLRLGKDRTDWWLTRRLTTLMVTRCMQKMVEVGLPKLSVPGVAPIERDLSQEHALSLEFDGPASQSSDASPAQHTLLASELSLSVNELECVIVLKSDKAHSQLKLTRKEAHAFLEMLASKAKSAGWLESPHWPGWLGGNISTSNN